MIVAYFDCFSGISGDMTLGALVDLELEPDFLKNELAKLKLDGYKISYDRTEKHGIAGTKAHVELTHHTDHNHHGHHHSRNLSDIRRLIEDSDLRGDVKAKSIAVFVKLGEAEARVHGTTIDEVHFHEVGAVDSIVDIVGSVIGISALGIEKIYSSAPSLGKGFTRSAHGIIPVPAPATLELLKGIPVRQTEIESELVTPTGAAIVSTLADGFGPAPEMVVEKIGYGAGDRDLAEQPNLLRIYLGTARHNYERDTVKVIETNIDDMSPQVYDLLIDKLLGIGALDVFLTPILMKKSRPAVMLTALVDSPHLQEVCDCILAETTTLGVRIYEADRKKLSREIIEVETEYGKVRAKLGKMGDQVVKILPEYEDCKRLAREKNVPIMKVQQAALKGFRMED
jgi:uncharacterized protein (TIGR00299 family) protein